MSIPKTFEEFNKQYPNWVENKKAWSGLTTMIDLELDAMFHGVSIKEYLAHRKRQRKEEIIKQIDDLKRHL